MCGFKEGTPLELRCMHLVRLPDNEYIQLLNLWAGLARSGLALLSMWACNELLSHSAVLIHANHACRGVCIRTQVNASSLREARRKLDSESRGMREGGWLGDAMGTELLLLPCALMPFALGGPHPCLTPENGRTPTTAQQDCPAPNHRQANPLMPPRRSGAT